MGNKEGFTKVVPPLFLKNLVCPYCKRDLTNPAKVLGGYTATTVREVMKFHLGLHREDVLREMIEEIKKHDSIFFEKLNEMVKKIEDIEDAMETVE
jgi:hypothetical protein